MKRFSIKCYLLIFIVLSNSFCAKNYTIPLSYFNQSISGKPYLRANYSCSLDTVYITLLDYDTQFTEACKPYIDPGATAWSLIDGNVTHLLKDSSNININIPGTYSITYYLPTGTIYWAAPVTRTVIVQANQPPIITLYGPDTIRTSVYETFTDPGFYAVDSCTGIKETHSIDSVDTARIGKYTIHYFATNNAGLIATKSRVVVVLDTTPPEILLIGQVYVQFLWNTHPPYIDEGCKVKDNYDSGLNYQTGGTYDSFFKDPQTGLFYITYDASDLSGNRAKRVTRLVRAVYDPGSIKMNQKSDILRLYPNPTRDIIYLDLVNPVLNGAEVKVYNTKGKVVRDIGKVYCTSKSYAINLDDLSGGIYLVQIRTAYQQETYRVGLIR